jgi:hypothetical protein
MVVGGELLERWAVLNGRVDGCGCMSSTWSIVDELDSRSGLVNIPSEIFGSAMTLFKSAAALPALYI